MFTATMATQSWVWSYFSKDPQDKSVVICKHSDLRSRLTDESIKALMTVRMNILRLYEVHAMPNPKKGKGCLAIGIVCQHRRAVQLHQNGP